MSVFILFSSFLLVVCMLKAFQNHKQGGAWGLPTVLGCVVLSIFLMVLNFRRGSPSHPEVRRRELSYQAALGDRLGREIQSRFPHGLVVVVSSGEEPVLLLDHMRRQLRPEGRLGVVKPDIEAEVRRIRTQMGNVESAEWADEMEEMLRMEAHLSVAMIEHTLAGVQGAADILVFLGPLPFDYQSLSIWSRTPRPAVILASGQDIWNLDSLRELLQSGLVHGLVAFNTAAWRTDGRVPSDPDKAFDERYHWIAAENIGLLDTLLP